MFKLSRLAPLFSLCECGRTEQLETLFALISIVIFQARHVPFCACTGRLPRGGTFTVARSTATRQTDGGRVGAISPSN